MDSTSKRTVENLLKEHQARPLKRFGQNFLIDKKVLKKIIEVADPGKRDIILEIGPGIGTLTQELAKRVKRVIAIEKDRKMIEILKETLADFKNIEIIQADILKLDPKPYILSEAKKYPQRYTLKSYKIVANLPYYIVSPVIRKSLESEYPPKEMILMVQKEVAQRICAKPPKMSILAVSVQFYAKPEILFYVPKNSFWPQPKVDGAILWISQIRTNLPRIDTNLFFKIVKAGFSQPRKQLANNLSKELKLDKEKAKDWLLKNGVNPTRRAETLSVEDWLNLTKTYL